MVSLAPSMPATSPEWDATGSYDHPDSGSDVEGLVYETAITLNECFIGRSETFAALTFGGIAVSLDSIGAGERGIPISFSSIGAGDIGTYGRRAEFFRASGTDVDTRHEADHLLGLDLAAALQELARIVDEAREEGYPEPEPVAIYNARLLVKRMYQLLPQRYDIYPTADGEIVIDGGTSARRFFAFCYSNGDVLYIGWVDGERHRERTSVEEDFAMPFLEKVLHQLGEYQAV